MSYLGELPGMYWDPQLQRYFARRPPDAEDSGSSSCREDLAERVKQSPVDEAVQVSLQQPVKRRKGEEAECSICADKVLESATELNCGHVFHTLCLREWMRRKGTCPTCREAIDS